jgi:hypothetical protein
MRSSQLLAACIPVGGATGVLYARRSAQWRGLYLDLPQWGLSCGVKNLVLQRDSAGQLTF